MRPEPSTADSLGAVFLAGALFWLGLGSYPLIEPSDARYAEIAREMFVSGDYLLPRLQGILHLHKPPLIYWLSATGYAVFGVNELGARACLAVLGCLTAGLLFRFGRRYGGDSVGGWAALVFACTPAVIGAARSLTTDLLLLACQTAALTAWYEVWSGRSRRAALAVFYFALGLGFFAKGPVALLVPLLVILIHGLLSRGRRRAASSWGIGWGLPLALLVAAPWYVYILVKIPGLLDYFLFDQLAGRVTSGGMGHTHSGFYYLLIFPALGLPWVLLAPRGIAAAGRSDPHLPRFLITWALVPPVLFSLPATKLPLYILGSYPPLALLAAWAIARSPERIRVPVIGGGLLMCLVGVSAAVLASGGAALPGGDLTRLSARDALLFGGPVAGLSLVTGLLVLRWGRVAPRKGAAMLVMWIAGVVSWCSLQGDRLPLRTAKPVATAFREMAGEHAQLVTYRDRVFGLPFYAGQLSQLVEVSAETQFDTATLVAERLPDTEEFKRQWQEGADLWVVTRPKRLKQLPGAKVAAEQGGFVLVRPLASSSTQNPIPAAR